MLGLVTLLSGTIETEMDELITLVALLQMFDQMYRVPLKDLLLVAPAGVVMILMEMAGQTKETSSLMSLLNGVI